MEPRPVKQVIVMRTDLNMRKGKMVAQGAHASMMFIRHRASSIVMLDDVEIEWLAGDHAKVCVGVESEEELNNILVKAWESGLQAYMVRDNGKTEFHGEKTRTCLAIGPDYSDLIDQVTGHLKLL